MYVSDIYTEMSDITQDIKYLRVSLHKSQGSNLVIDLDSVTGFH